MKLIDANWKPTDRQLRQFGVICLIALPLVGYMWGAGTLVIGILAAVGLILAVTGIVVPRAVKPVFLALMIITVPIGIVIGELAMLLIYFGVFLPMGLVFRLLKRDALQRKFDRHATTYWQAKSQPTSAARYYRQS